MSTPNKISYKDAGVDVERGDAFVERIKSRVASTYTDRVVAGVGGFAALYRMGGGKLLAAGTDGVGTKVKIAQKLGKHDTIGIDLVAMCANDVICTGATPLFFLDYIATAKIDLVVSEDIIKGIVDGCKQAGMALIGGETAEMPGLYQPNEYDLAGFCIGELEETALIDGTKIKEGDTLIALPSSGLHSNGFSLVRKLVDEDEKDILIDCLAPTRIYWHAIKDIRSHLTGIAHITGGGLTNIPRLHENVDYILHDLPDADMPDIFHEMEKRSGLDAPELYTTFNMGIGMALATAAPDAVTDHLKKIGEKYAVIGEIKKGDGKVRVSTPKKKFTLE